MKKTLLFLHGWASDASVWKEQKCFFQDYEVITPQLKADNLADNVNEAKQICRGKTDIAVIAWSMGALTAFKLFEAMPNIKAFIGIASTPKFISEDYIEAGIKLSELRALRAGLKRGFIGTLDKFYKQNRIPLKAKDLFEKKDLFIRQLDILEKEDLRGELAAVRCPALFLAGEEDVLCPVSVQEYMRQRIPGSAVKVIEGAAHAPFMEKAGDINNLINEFLKNI